jgi:hypothetical protein
MLGTPGATWSCGLLPPRVRSCGLLRPVMSCELFGLVPGERPTVALSEGAGGVSDGDGVGATVPGGVLVPGEPTLPAAPPAVPLEPPLLPPELCATAMLLRQTKAVATERIRFMTSPFLFHFFSHTGSEEGPLVYKRESVLLR